MKVEAAAKINLGLHVLRRRSDGYHDIETVMLRLGWFDTVEVAPADRLVMTCSDPDLPVGSDNLCLKAANALASRFDSRLGAHIHLEKRIPVAAGLGGGSSDAAATLRLLSRFWGLSTTDQELAEIGAEIGADTPFFLGPSPAIGRGRGEKLKALTSADGDRLAIPFTFSVIKPDTAVSTADAYRWLTPSERNRVDLEALIRSRDLARWREELVNDFERPVEQRVPEIGRIKSMLLDAGAAFAGLSGSGSAVFGVFLQPQGARTVTEAARSRGYTAWFGKEV